MDAKEHLKKCGFDPESRDLLRLLETYSCSKECPLDVKIKKCNCNLGVIYVGKDGNCQKCKKPF